MGIQEIIAGIIVLSAAFYSFRIFFKQFTSKEGTCDSCSCEPVEKRFRKASLNSPVYKKIKQ